MNTDSLKNALENQIRRLKKKTAALEKQSSRISAFRFFDFVVMLVLIFLAAKFGNTWIFLSILIAGIAGFMALISWHRKIDKAIERFKGWTKIRSHHLARLTLNWEDIPQSHRQKNYDSHPFARDFDIVGKHSLMQLLNTATYPGGTDRLEGWLLKKEPDLLATKKRQTLVKELRPMAHFRDRLHLYADLADKKSSKYDWGMDELLLWVQSTQQKGYTIPLIILGTLAGLNITLLALYLAGVLGPYVIFTFIAYLITYNFYSKKISGLFNEADQIQKLLSQFREVLTYLESFPYKKQSVLEKFCAPFHEADQQPGKFLKRIIRIASAASSQGSELQWLLYNLIVPWDMYFAKQLNSYKQELAPKLTLWLDRFYRLEGLNSMANFAWLNPDYTFSLPHQDTQALVFEAKDLGHPLIERDQKVTNNVIIEKVGDIQLITGSNMAGKSTYLRTIGINLSLCFAGAPVNATSFDTILFRLFSSINVTDSLDEGLSHFYAEVKRLRALVDQLQQPHEHPLFFMVDEIYRGTNNRERLKGSEAFLKHVAGKDGIGLVSTHDLELAQLENEIPTLSNWHFEETIEDGKMRFEYKLKTGPCPSTNALKIMQMEGLPV
jgi:Flp pilus assembly protein TadB